MISRFGAHSIRKQDDLLTMTIGREISLDDIKQLIAACDEAVALYGRFGVIADVRALHSIAPEARRFAGGWSNVEQGYGVAVFGASLPMRTLISLLSRAMELFMRRRHGSELGFFKTEQEAYDWVMRKRSQPKPRQS
jgi:hypothetical protein